MGSGNQGILDLYMISVIVFVAMLSDIPSGNKSSSVNAATALPFLISVFFLLALSIISGCAGKVILSDDAIRIRNTVDKINQLKELYEQHDEGMLSLFSSEYLSESGMKDDISQDIRRFGSISLSIFIDRIEIDKDLVNVSVHWKGSWGDGDKILKDGGSAVIIIRSGDGLKVVDIKGDSPFGISNK